MNPQIRHFGGVPYVATPYRRDVHIREDVFRRQFRVQCDGRFEYPEDERIWGTYHLDGAVILGECGLIDEAMALAESCVSRHEFDLGDDPDLLGFHPQIVVIHDNIGSLALAGDARCGTMDWCEPVSTEVEAAEITQQVRDLCREACFEMGWDNFCTARGLRLRARILEGRLVDRSWREHARAAILAN